MRHRERRTKMGGERQTGDGNLNTTNKQRYKQKYKEMPTMLMKDKMNKRAKKKRTKRERH